MFVPIRSISLDYLMPRHLKNIFMNDTNNSIEGNQEDGSIVEGQNSTAEAIVSVFSSLKKPDGTPPKISEIMNDEEYSENDEESLNGYGDISRNVGSKESHEITLQGSETQPTNSNSNPSTMNEYVESEESIETQNELESIKLKKNSEEKKPVPEYRAINNESDDVDEINSETGRNLDTKKVGESIVNFATKKVEDFGKSNITDSAEKQFSCRALNMKCKLIDINFQTESLDEYFDIPYCKENVSIDDGALKLSISKECSTTLISKFNIKFGLVEGRIKMAPGSGSVTALLLAGPEPADEIDFEWVGIDSSTVQSMYFVAGKPIDMDAVFFESGGDMSDNFFDYAIELLPNVVNWYINDELVRSVERVDESTFPSRADTLRFGVWDGSEISEWAGESEGDNQSSAYFKYIKVTEYCFEE
ncbi:putative glycosidase CRH1 [Smittium mucronatum]|uniref:Putative glycosidase CRH1 n=1 Tax=Smittium mucronatum TaxID=133383 RepID=A0A1R0GXX6_9FUNG|nr:putative glycosidase CRH1 [Smittium mucronatum]